MMMLAGRSRSSEYRTSTRCAGPPQDDDPGGDENEESPQVWLRRLVFAGIAERKSHCIFKRRIRSRIRTCLHTLICCRSEVAHRPKATHSDGLLLGTHGSSMISRRYARVSGGSIGKDYSMLARLNGPSTGARKCLTGEYFTG